MDSHQNIKVNSFVSVNPQQPRQNNFIAFVIGLWGVSKFSNQVIYIHCERCEIGEIDDLHGMKVIKKSGKEEFISAEKLISGLNIQHNCEGEKFAIKRTLPRKLERQETTMMLKEVQQSYNFYLYIINTAFLRNQMEHHLPAKIFTLRIQNISALDAIHDGLSEWKKNSVNKGKTKSAESITFLDPSITSGY